MAVVVPIENTPTNAVNRSYRTMIDTPVVIPVPAGVTPHDGGMVTALRETQAFDANNQPVGNPQQDPMMQVTRTFSDWGKDPPVTITLDAGGTVDVTGEMIIKAVQAYGDYWVQTEIDAGRRAKDGRTIPLPFIPPSTTPPPTP